MKWFSSKQSTFWLLIPSLIVWDEQIESSLYIMKKKNTIDHTWHTVMVLCNAHTCLVHQCPKVLTFYINIVSGQYQHWCNRCVNSRKNVYLSILSTYFFHLLCLGTTLPKLILSGWQMPKPGYLWQSIALCTSFNVAKLTFVI